MCGICERETRNTCWLNAARDLQILLVFYLNVYRELLAIVGSSARWLVRSLAGSFVRSFARSLALFVH